MTRLFLLFLLTSCASTKIMEQVKKDNPENIRPLEVVDRAEARKEILRDYNFLKLLFEESRDPYYGMPKWGEECLKANTFEYKEDEKFIALLTNLVVNADLKPGFCPTKLDSKRRRELYLYCGTDKEYWRIIIPQNEKIILEAEALCP